MVKFYIKGPIQHCQGHNCSYYWSLVQGITECKVTYQLNSLIDNIVNRELFAFWLFLIANFWSLISLLSLQWKKKSVITSFSVELLCSSYALQGIAKWDLWVWFLTMSITCLLCIYLISIFVYWYSLINFILWSFGKWSCSLI